MSNLIVRMPPSPTGKLHLGTARTALFNWCFAKAHQGEIIFRWEDTDRERSKTEFETEILDGLKWLGMDFVGQKCKFFRQTQNTDRHQKMIQKLWETEKIFPCFTTPKDIENARETAAKNKTNFVFWSEYRDKKKEVLESKMKSGQKFVWRFRMPKDEIFTFTDLVKGEISTNSNTLGDFVVARSDGSVLYMLANITDDLHENITHVVRGDDHISNTPKQLALLQALSKKPFVYSHIPLIIDQNKKKLSKRNLQPGVCILIQDFRQSGFVPQAVVNGLAMLGWNPKSEQEIFSLQELEDIFDLKNVNKASAQYNFEKILWFNNQWMNQISEEKLKNYFFEWTGKYGKHDQDFYDKIPHFNKAFALAKIKAKTLAEIETEFEYLGNNLPPVESQDLKNLFEHEKMKIDKNLSIKVLEEIYKILENQAADKFNPEDIKEISVQKIAEMKLKNGPFLWPFRAALSHQQKSPGPFDLAFVFGKKLSLERIKKTLDFLKG